MNLYTVTVTTLYHVVASTEEEALEIYNECGGDMYDEYIEDIDLIETEVEE